MKRIAIGIVIGLGLMLAAERLTAHVQAREHQYRLEEQAKLLKELPLAIAAGMNRHAAEQERHTIRPTTTREIFRRGQEAFDNCMASGYSADACRAKGRPQQSATDRQP